MADPRVVAAIKRKLDPEALERKLGSLPKGGSVEDAIKTRIDTYDEALILGTELGDYFIKNKKHFKENAFNAFAIPGFNIILNKYNTSFMINQKEWERSFTIVLAQVQTILNAEKIDVPVIKNYLEFLKSIFIQKLDEAIRTKGGRFGKKKSRRAKPGTVWKIVGGYTEMRIGRRTNEYKNTKTGKMKTVHKRHLKKKTGTVRRKYRKVAGRKSPAESANDWCGRKKKGLDGKMWLSVRTKAGHCKWNRTK